MVRIVGVLLVLLAVVWLASQIPATPSAEQPRTDSWRRTCNGWERAEWLYGDQSHRPPALHPALVGMVLLLFASAALIGLSPEAGRIRRTCVPVSAAASPATFNRKNQSKRT